MSLFVVIVLLSFSAIQAESQSFLIKKDLVLDLDIHQGNKDIVIKNGKWRIDESSLYGKEVLADHHDASFRVFVPLKGSFVTEIEFRFLGCDEFSMAMLGGGQGQVAHLSQTHMWHRIKSGKAKGIPKIYGYNKVDLDLEQYQTIRLEVHKGKMLYTINDQEQLFSIDETLSMEHSSFAICIGGGEAVIRSLKMWKAIENPSFKQGELDPPKKYSLGEHQFLKGDKNDDAQLTLEEFSQFPNMKKNDDKNIVSLFQKKDQNRDQVISYAEWMKGVR